MRVRGWSALVALVQGPVTIAGVLDASASRSAMSPQDGPGAEPDPQAPCRARALWSTTAFTPGGGGGGRYDFGGGGGMAANGSVAAASGEGRDDLTLIPLVGGCRGAWLAESDGAQSTSFPGYGGGAVQIVSRTKVTLFGNGVINVSGGGAASGDRLNPGVSLGGPGGGSGGAILIEAPEIVLDGGGVVLAAKGGGGAAAGPVGFNGADGGYGPGPAAGGVNPNGADGGAGGTETTAPQRGEDARGSVADGGGGGGSAGVCRLNTRTGAVTLQNGAAIRCRRATNTTYAERLLP